jgi:hypothetical protein
MARRRPLFLWRDLTGGAGGVARSLSTASDHAKRPRQVIGLRGTRSNRSRRPGDRIRRRSPRGRATSLATWRCLETGGRPDKRCAAVDGTHAAAAGSAARPCRREITRRRRSAAEAALVATERAEPGLGTDVAGARGSATSSAGRSYVRSVDGRRRTCCRRLQGAESCVLDHHDAYGPLLRAASWPAVTGRPDLRDTLSRSALAEVRGTLGTASA